jgi:hypothetical protein
MLLVCSSPLHLELSQCCSNFNSYKCAVVARPRKVPHIHLNKIYTCFCVNQLDFHAPSFLFPTYSLLITFDLSQYKICRYERTAVFSWLYWLPILLANLLSLPELSCLQHALCLQATCLLCKWLPATTLADSSGGRAAQSDSVVLKAAAAAAAAAAL